MELLNALVAGLVVGGAYALLALGVSLIFSTTGVLNFAQAAFAMLAAYVYSWASGEQDWSPVRGRHLRRGRRHRLRAGRRAGRRAAHQRLLARHQMMATVAVLAVTQGLMLQLFGFQPKIAERLAPSGSVYIGDLGISYQQILLLVVTTILCARPGRLPAPDPPGPGRAGRRPEPHRRPHLRHPPQPDRPSELAHRVVPGLGGRCADRPADHHLHRDVPRPAAQGPGRHPFRRPGRADPGRRRRHHAWGRWSRSPPPSPTFPAAASWSCSCSSWRCSCSGANWPEDLTAAPSLRDTTAARPLGPGAVRAPRRDRLGRASRGSPTRSGVPSAWWPSSTPSCRSAWSCSSAGAGSCPSCTAPLSGSAPSASPGTSTGSTCPWSWPSSWPASPARPSPGSSR